MILSIEQEIEMLISHGYSVTEWIKTHEFDELPDIIDRRYNSVLYIYDQMKAEKRIQELRNV